MTCWFIDQNRSRWRLCEIISRGIGYVNVRLHDGTPARGVARKGIFGELIEAR